MVKTKALYGKALFYLIIFYDWDLFQGLLEMNTRPCPAFLAGLWHLS